MATQLRIAYTMQNTGFDLTSEIGDAIPVKYTLNGLRKAGHKVGLLALNRNKVTKIDDVSNLDTLRYVSLGLTGTRPFRLLESGIRRLQGELRLPYFAFFDSYRFYEACYRDLPKYDLCHEHNALLSVGAPVSAKELGISESMLVKALIEAAGIRPRHTILHEKPVTPEKAKEAAKATGVSG